MLAQLAFRVRHLLRRHTASSSAQAKAYWQQQGPTGTPFADRIAAVAESPRRLLEFGANDGGNLRYFLERNDACTAVGIDLHPRVLSLSHPRYQGLVGDETTLAALTDAFDLAFTISVLDHIPDRRVVAAVIRDLVRLAPRVVLLEPWIPSIDGDVSGELRGVVVPGAPQPHKRFAPQCYLWNYDAILADLRLTWTKDACPLYATSCGPFYHRYVITAPEG